MQEDRSPERRLRRPDASCLTTLRRNGEFRRAYGRGKSLAAPALVTYAVRNRLRGSRYGITASKKVGGAVERNRCRRVIREALRTLDEPLRGGWDLVFVARARTKDTKSTRIQEIMREHLRGLGVTARGGADASRKPMPPNEKGQP